MLLFNPEFYSANRPDPEERGKNNFEKNIDWDKTLKIKKKA